MRVLNADKVGKTSVLFHKNDRKILSLLCYNARLPISKIAKLSRLSRQSTEYRIKVMEKNHLIAGSRAVINIKKLGYGSYHFFLNIRTESSEKEFRERCLKSNHVNALISYSGKWNYEVSLMEKNPSDAYDKFLDLIKGIEVVEYFPCIILDTIKSSVLPGEIDEKKPNIKNIKNDPSFSRQFDLPKKEYKTDKKDKEILYLLSQNAQISLSYIGKKVGLTKDAVSYRIKKLIRGRYIFQFRPVIDFSVLNLSIQTVLIRSLPKTKEQEDKFNNYLRSSDKVLWATKLFGQWNYLIYVINKDPNDIHEFIKNLKKDFEDYIHSYEIVFAYHEYKYSFMTPVISS